MSDTPETQRPHEIRMRDILETVLEFDPFGGSSLGLTAWELGVAPEAIESIWRSALSDGLVQDFEADPVLGERLCRITPAGRARLAGA